jgi:hypothetical protein
MEKILPVFLFFWTALAVSADGPPLRDCDIVFQVSRSGQSRAIQIATRSKYSHMGIVFFVDGRPMVLEATTPVRLTPWNLWVLKGVGGHVVVKRLKNAAGALTPGIVRKMRDLGFSWLGRKYDGRFEWTDDRLYCSELVWKLYRRAAGIEVGRLGTLADFDLSHPVVRKKLRERYGGTIPLAEPVIAPSAMFDSNLLTTVYKN